MTFCADRSFKWSDDVCLLVQAWFPDPVSTLGADEVFRHMRSAEGVTTKNGDTSPIQLQPMAIKALSGRYADFETSERNPARHGEKECV